MACRIFSLSVVVLLCLEGCASSVHFPSTSSVKPAMLSARLFRPNGDGPFPAMVLLHGCSGLSGHCDWWASWFEDEGYVALVVDSCGPRYIQNICGPQGRLTLSVSDRVGDAFGALVYMRSLPFVDRERIGVIGWSHGGSTALRTSATGVQPLDGGFRIAVALYPGCPSDLSTDNIPVLLLLGESDDWTPAAPCVAFAQRVQQAGGMVQWIVYPGAHHGFDVRRRSRVSFGHYLNYSPQAASDAQSRVHAFLTQYLGVGAHT
jgi:dienelactone hydrolase